MKNYAVRMTTGNPARRRAPARGLTWAWGGVDFRPIRRWRRAAAFLVLCASLAVPLLGAGGSAQAAVLVSNFGESATSATSGFSLNGDSHLAQVFTTGTHAAGYTLTSVEIGFHSAISAADIGDLSVNVWSVDSSGNPQTKQFDLTKPASIAAVTFNAMDVITGNYAEFTAPSNTTLTQTTNYAFVLTYDAPGGLWTTVIDMETSAASGWSIANDGLRKPSAGSWGAIRTILIRVNGEPKVANTAPTSVDKEVVTDEDTDYTFLTADFAFTDTDMGDTLLSVKIVTLPSKGTLTLSGTALTSGDLPQTVTAADLTASNLKYGPPANESGNRLASFTFRVNDGTADSVATNTMTIGVQSINDVATGQPGITGTAQVGEVLTATAGDIADVDGLPAPFFESGTTTVQWLRVDGGNETDIPGATDFTYTLVAADEGKTIKVKVVNFNDEPGFTNGPLTSDAYPSSGTVLPAASTNTAPTSADKTVTATEDTDYTFSSADFPFTDTDGDSLSSVKIVTLPATGTLTLSGTALTSGDLPQTVTAAELTASNLKYAPLANSTLVVLFTFRVNDGTDDSAATYTMTIGVAAVNDAPTGQPGITGTAQVGEVLMATAGDIADVDGLHALFFSVGDATTTVQWLRVDGVNETDIPSATAFTYTLVAADEGKTIKVKVVSFNDKTGFANGPLTSDAYPSSGTVLPAAATNNAPIVANAIPDQVAPVGGLFIYNVPFNTFSDADTDTLSYSATKADDTMLPTWLTFNPAANHRTFSGTPQAADVGMVSVKVTASDGKGGSVSDVFDITVEVDTTPPTLSSATVLSSGISISFGFSETLETLSAFLPPASAFTVTADGIAVPVDQAGANVGSFVVTLSPVFIRQGQVVVVTYTDPTTGDDAQAIQDFAGNDAASFTTGMSGVSAVTNNSTKAAVAPDAPMGLTAIASGTTTINLSWTAPVDNGGSVITGYKIEVSSDSGSTWTDQVANTASTATTYEHTGLTASTTRHYRVSAINSIGASTSSDVVNTTTGTAANNAPIVANAIPDQTATADAAFSYQFPANTFNDVDTGDTLIYTATKADGTALPTWLGFDAATRTFAGTPAATDVETVSVKVTANDSNGGLVSDKFNITVEAGDTTPPTLTSVTVLPERCTDISQVLRDGDAVGRPAPGLRLHGHCRWHCGADSLGRCRCGCLFATRCLA